MGTIRVDRLALCPKFRDSAPDSCFVLCMCGLWNFAISAKRKKAAILERNGGLDVLHSSGNCIEDDGLCAAASPIWKWEPLCRVSYLITATNDVYAAGDRIFSRATHQSPVAVAFTRFRSNLNDESSPLRKIQSKAKTTTRAIAKKTIPPW